MIGLFAVRGKTLDCSSMMVMFVHVVLRLARCTDLVLCVVCFNIIMLVWFLSVMC